MKKITLVLAVAMTFMFAACNNGKQKGAQDQTDSTETFEVQTIKAGMNVQLDSLTSCILRLQPSKFYKVGEDGKIVLTDAEKKVAPDYLMDPEKLADKLETMSSKYRALTVYYIDKQIADLYGMKDNYSPAISKLASEINDPALKLLMNGEMKYDGSNAEEVNKKLYAIEEENGRANRFWEAAATAIVEQTYLLTQNQEKFLASFTDKDAEDVTYRIALLVNSFEELSEYDPALMQLLTVIQPLEKINAISVDQFRQQLTEMKEEVAKSRASLFE